MPPSLSDTSIGAIIVTFNAADVIGACLDSLLAQSGAVPRIVVVDNASDDDTVNTLRHWAAAHGLGTLAEAATVPEAAALTTGAPVVLLHSGANRGFAGGVNLGLAVLALRPMIRHFWVLNPDAFADKGATAAIERAAAVNPDYGIIGGRVCYAEPPHRIQIDGGTINRWTGVTSNINLGAEAAKAALPDSADLDFVTGANLVASRAFYDKVGPMREDYFLYYEEADWALRRGDMPIILAPGFVVYHHAGTAIGSPTLERIASPFSFWFKYRSRMMFVRRFYPASLPVAVLYATAKALQLIAKGAYPQAATLLRAVWGLSAPRVVRERLSTDATRIAFGK
jgi:GT2 family glycosyltransferase